MIVEWFLGVIAGLVEWILARLPVAEPPGWIAEGVGSITTLFGYMHSLSVWVPVTLGGLVVTAVLLCLVVGFAIKVGRIVLSFGLLGGGSAG